MMCLSSGTGGVSRIPLPGMVSCGPVSSRLQEKDNSRRRLQTIVVIALTIILFFMGEPEGSPAG